MTEPGERRLQKTVRSRPAVSSVMLLEWRAESIRTTGSNGDRTYPIVVGVIHYWACSTTNFQGLHMSDRPRLLLNSAPSESMSTAPSPATAEGAHPSQWLPPAQSGGHPTTWTGVLSPVAHRPIAVIVVRCQPVIGSRSVRIRVNTMRATMGRANHRTYTHHLDLFHEVPAHRHRKLPLVAARPRRYSPPWDSGLGWLTTTTNVTLASQALGVGRQVWPPLRLGVDLSRRWEVIAVRARRIGR